MPKMKSFNLFFLLGNKLQGKKIRAKSCFSQVRSCSSHCGLLYFLKAQYAFLSLCSLAHTASSASNVLCFGELLLVLQNYM